MEFQYIGKRSSSGANNMNDGFLQFICPQKKGCQPNPAPGEHNKTINNVTDDICATGSIFPFIVPVRSV